MASFEQWFLWKLGNLIKTYIIIWYKETTKVLIYIYIIFEMLSLDGGAFSLNIDHIGGKFVKNISSAANILYLTFMYEMIIPV